MKIYEMKKISVNENFPPVHSASKTARLARQKAAELGRGPRP
jgi:hypothetical protein